MKDRSFLGIIFILLGVGFLLEQFNIISFYSIISIYWPIILIALGIVGFLKKSSSKIVNTVLIVLGILFQARNLGILDINIFKLFWPIILIIIGLRILLPAKDMSRDKNDDKGKEDFKDSKDKSDRENISYEDSIHEFAIMSGLETSIESQEFRGGNITTIMASVELDLRDAKLYNNKANIDINVVMGGIEIFVPENWKIEHNGTPILGEFSNKKRYKEDPDAPVLNINFFLLMSSIEIK